MTPVATPSNWAAAGAVVFIIALVLVAVFYVSGKPPEGPR